MKPLPKKISLFAALPTIATASILLLIFHYLMLVNAKETAWITRAYIASKQSDLSHSIDIAAKAVRSFYNSGRNDHITIANRKKTLPSTPNQHENGYFIYDIAANGHAAHVLVLSVIMFAILLSLIWLGCFWGQQRSARIARSSAAQQVAAAEIAERSRVARELHDGVCQLLIAARYFFESAFERCPSASRDIAIPLRLGLSRLEDSIREIRKVSNNLHSVLLDDFELNMAIDHLGGEFEKRTAIDVTMTTNIRQGPSPAAKHELLRIVQEALTNIEKHAHASRVAITFEERNDHFVLTVADDGQGLRATEYHDGIHQRQGLNNMRERLADLGGTLLLRSTVGQTEVVAQIPIIVARDRKVAERGL